MKSKPFISQIKKKDFVKYHSWKNKVNVLEILPTLQNTLKKIILIQKDIEGRFSDFAVEELASINPFFRTEQNIMKMPSEYRWNLLIQVKFSSENEIWLTFLTLKWND